MLTTSVRLESGSNAIEKGKQTHAQGQATAESKKSGCDADGTPKQDRALKPPASTVSRLHYNGSY